MIPRSTTDINVIDSNIDGESIDMTIDTNSLSHIMSVLTDLYSDTMLACVREYSTNARDAHLESGLGDVPIEVSTPSRFSPMFKVRDYGNGLSLDAIRNVYSKYGSSTKRNSDIVNGMLGLGAKSALTYTPSFTVVSVNNGMKHTVSVGRHDGGGGYMEVVDSSPTTDPSGVEIQIPVATGDISTFASKVGEFYTFWEAGTVKVDGVVNSGPYLGEYIKIDDSTYFQSGVYGDSIIVMGGVAYPSPFENPFHQRSSRFIHFADMGDVVFSPSRESLLTNSKNRQFFNSIVEKVKANIAASAQSHIDEAEDVQSAYIRSREIGSSLLYPVMGSSAPSLDSFAYRGSSLKDYEDRILKIIQDDDSLFYGNSRTAGASTSFYNVDAYSRSIPMVVNVKVVITGLDPEVMRNDNRRRTILRGIRYLGYGNTNILSTDTDGTDLKSVLPSSKMIDAVNVREAAREDLKNSRTNSTAKKVAKAADGNIDKIIGANDGIMNTVITPYSGDGSNLVFLSRSDLREASGAVSGYSIYTRTQNFNAIASAFPNVEMVAVPLKAQDKFKKVFPKARSYREFYDSVSTVGFMDLLMNAAQGKFTKDDVIAWAISVTTDTYSTGSDIRSLKVVARGMSTPAFTKFKNACDKFEEVDKAFNTLSRTYGSWFDNYKFKNYATALGKGKTVETMGSAAYELINKYPLIAGRSSATPHLVQYVAAVDSGVIV